MGFSGMGAQRPQYFYGRRHDYVYYPIAWVDASTGRQYEKGYYDEDGKYYDSVSFQKNGKYENVVCRCSYCGTEHIINLDSTNGTSLEMKCPNCGAPMEIASTLDEILDQTSDEKSSSYNSNSERSYASDLPVRSYVAPWVTAPARKKRRGGLLVFILAIIVIIAIGSAAGSKTIGKEPPTNNVSSNNPVVSIQEPANSDVIYLATNGRGEYYEVSSSSGWSKSLIWDYSADSYYDATTDCWLWYNTDVEPALWQYWYEGISSDFGDYGWMEHDQDGWWIEESEGNWIPLPSEYDTDGLWYISD